MVDQSDVPFRILVIDDDAEMRESLETLLQSAHWTTHTLPRAARALEVIGQFQPDVILTDVRMPGIDGIELLQSLLKQNAPPVVLMTAHGDIPMAVGAIQTGAFGFFEKPFEPRRLLEVLKNAATQHRLTSVNDDLRERLSRMSKLDRVFLGDSREAMELRDRIIDFSAIGVPVLLIGETGTGKEMIANALHELGSRSSGKFVVVNCALLSPENFDKVFFGDGDDSLGLVEMATGGTLVLDEVSVCTPRVQAQLLRLLENKDMHLSGGLERGLSDTRVLSTTNVALDPAIKDGTFRRDLYFRLNVVSVTLPSLRQRKSDIPMMFTVFMDEYAGNYDIKAPTLTSDDLAALLAHDWRGNVRELRHVAERRILAARRGGGSVADAIGSDEDGFEVSDSLRSAVAVFEGELITKALLTHHGKMDAVAEALGIGRRTLNEKIVKLGLDKDAIINRQ
ncbi:sigma-54 dependent transcriptional regulator [Yoonia sp.]|uniref:sigma-54-dependent transcriptional regulator n=1 Tax=Yoonia sp. TaxID=2212373 RepID=UPI0025E26738|nr:sigma-54 dependent transcriptional regulator [Yoonia sp.]